MRLIDADTIFNNKMLVVRTECYDAVRAVIERINNAPTVDAVEVVRCKDCKKYIPCQKLPIGTSKWCGLFDRATCGMNYCGWGERREDEDNRC